MEVQSVRKLREWTGKLKRGMNDLDSIQKEVEI
jgi:hypothetical protein